VCIPDFLSVSVKTLTVSRFFTFSRFWSKSVPIFAAKNAKSMVKGYTKYIYLKNVMTIQTQSPVCDPPAADKTELPIQVLYTTGTWPELAILVVGLGDFEQNPKIWNLKFFFCIFEICENLWKCNNFRKWYFQPKIRIPATNTGMRW
jgi:hypothetical protein